MQKAATLVGLANTHYYVSMIDDLDVNVAISMRNRDDFRKMAEFCDDIFSSTRLKDFSLRHFDPTLSAASGHEDKGLIECLMVKCAKLLVYVAGERDSYGKEDQPANPSSKTSFTFSPFFRRNVVTSGPTLSSTKKIWSV